VKYAATQWEARPNIMRSFHAVLARTRGTCSKLLRQPRLTLGRKKVTFILQISLSKSCRTGREYGIGQGKSVARNVVQQIMRRSDELLAGVPVLFYNSKYIRTNGITQNYWIFGLYPSSGILQTRKHNVSGNGSVFVLRWRGRHLLCWVR
jgi:hypothetical protein